MNRSPAQDIADTVVELAAQDRAAGGMEAFSDEELIERRATMEVREYEERTGASLPDDAVNTVQRLAKKYYWASREGLA